MNYSSAHKSFANYVNCRDHNINKQDVLDHPENYLGPNYREVLNCWFYWDSLSDEQWEVFDKRWGELSLETREKSRKTATELAAEVIDPRFVHYFDYEELEIIAASLY